jgi:hypothetical protein
MSMPAASATASRPSMSATIARGISRRVNMTRILSGHENHCAHGHPRRQIGIPAAPQTRNHAGAFGTAGARERIPLLALRAWMHADSHASPTRKRGKSARRTPKSRVRDTVPGAERLCGALPARLAVSLHAPASGHCGGGGWPRPGHLLKSRPASGRPHFPPPRP